VLAGNFLLYEGTLQIPLVYNFTVPNLMLGNLSDNTPIYPYFVQEKDILRSQAGTQEDKKTTRNTTLIIVGKFLLGTVQCSSVATK